MKNEKKFLAHTLVNALMKVNGANRIEIKETFDSLLLKLATTSELRDIVDSIEGGFGDTIRIQEISDDGAITDKYQWPGTKYDEGRCEQASELTFIVSHLVNLGLRRSLMEITGVGKVRRINEEILQEFCALHSGYVMNFEGEAYLPGLLKPLLTTEHKSYLLDQLDARLIAQGNLGTLAGIII